MRPVSLPAPPGSTMATGYIDARLQHLRADERHMRRRSARGAPLLFRALLGLITTVMLLLLWMRQPLVSTSSAAVRERVPAKPHKVMPDAITPQDDALGLLSSHATSEASPPLSPEPAAAPLPSSREQPQRRRRRHDAAIGPPYSAESDCRRGYDRHGRGDGFARCGTSAESFSCCRHQIRATPCKPT